MPLVPNPENTDAMPEPTQAHTSSQFGFILSAALDRAAPLFGPEGERCWAGPQWDPKFIYPATAKDTQGAVFTIEHSAHTSVWVNTLFDQEHGRMQYVSFVSEKVVSVINVRLEEQDKSTTQVHVTYERTALHPEANGEVEAMGRADRESGPRWQEAIERCLAGQP
jgi:hypothetical protein